MLTPPGNMPMQPMAQPAPPMQAPMPPAMMTRNNAGRRRGFGDYLENMLDRPMMAADNMGDFDVFTGQPVVQMRGGGSVYDAYKSADFKAYTDSKKNTYAPTVRGATPGRAVKTHAEIMADLRSRSSSNDKPKPKPVAVTRDDDYTPTSAELDAQLKDMAAIGMPDLRQDQFEVDMPMFPDIQDRINQIKDDSAADLAFLRQYGVLGDPDDRATILAPGTGGLSSVDPVGSGMNPSNVYVDPLDPFGGPGPDISISSPDPRSYVGSGMNPLTAYGPTSPDAFIGTGPNISAPRNYVGSGANPLTAYGPTSSDAFLGTGDPLDLGIGAPVGGGRGAGPGGVLVSGGTNLPSGTEGGTTLKDEVQKMIEEFKKVPGNIANDIKMGIDAGFYTDFEVARQRLMATGKYTKEEVDSWINRTKITAANNQKKMAEQQGKDDDDSPVNPCQPGYVLDPATGICVPESEVAGSEGGANVSLNRARDDEFAELDDIMKIIEKPANMKAGGMAGLNRVADGFLAAMGG